MSNRTHSSTYDEFANFPRPMCNSNGSKKSSPNSPYLYQNGMHIPPQNLANIQPSDTSFESPYSSPTYIPTPIFESNPLLNRPQQTAMTMQDSIQSPRFT